MKLALFFSLAFLSACASGPCNNQARNGEQQQVAAVSPQSASSSPAPDPKTLKVYKADGSRQCGQGKAIDLKVMEAQLTKAGIKILSSAKQPDGMMHTQVCGAPTGTANTYEIAPADLKKAEKLGFSRLEN